MNVLIRFRLEVRKVPDNYNLHNLPYCMKTPENHKLMIARKDVENIMDDSWK